jgi:hypothetical protein
MATTIYFEKDIPHPDKPKEYPTNFQVGLTTYIGTHTLLFRMGDKSILLDKESTGDFLKRYEAPGFI